MPVAITITNSSYIEMIERIKLIGTTSYSTDEISAKILAKIRLQFRNSTDPYGQPWASVRRAGQPLLDTGRLRGSIQANTNGDTMVFFTDVEYAQYHQFGERVKKRAILPDDRGLPESWEAIITSAIKENFKSILGN